MEIVLEIIKWILIIVIAYFVKSTAAKLATSTLSWPNGTWKNAFQYGLYVTILGAIGALLTWLLLSYFQYIFFILILAWFYIAILIFGSVYQKGFWGSLGGLIVTKIMELAIFAIIAGIGLSLVVSFGGNQIPLNNDFDLSALENFNSLEGLGDTGSEEDITKLLESLKDVQ